MPDLVENVLLPFLSIFIGAFLAVRLEAYRVRRSCMAWARAHLSHIRRPLADDLAVSEQVDLILQRQTDACAVWVAAGPDDTLTNEQWDSIVFSLGASSPDFGALLRTETVSVLPAELALAFSRTENEARVALSMNEAVKRALDEVLPLWFERRVPLNPADQRRVQLLRESVETFAAQVRAVRGPLNDVVTRIDAFLGRENPMTR